MCRFHLALCNSLWLLVSSLHDFLKLTKHITDIFRWGPVAWIIISEVFPLGMRAKGVSLGGQSNWLNNVSYRQRGPMKSLKI